ncbi:MAG: hypothetical protein ACXACX_22170, partial [Candidatus Hodarchaeales archaeon]
MSIRLVIPIALGSTIGDIANGNISLIPFYAIIILASGIFAEIGDWIMSMFNEVLAQNLEMTTRVEFFNSMIRKKMSF